MISVKVVGLSGATCSGKTSVCNILKKIFVNSRMFNQDDYYWDEDSPNHCRIAESGFINWEVMSSFDMKSLLKDLRDEMSKSNSSSSKSMMPKHHWTVENTFKSSSSDELAVDSKAFDHIKLIIVEGILVLNDPDVANLCQHKFFVELDKPTCWERRKTRTYDPEDQLGYFESLAWPYYLANLHDLKASGVDCIYLRGEHSVQENVCRILNALQKE